MPGRKLTPEDRAIRKKAFFMNRIHAATTASEAIGAAADYARAVFSGAPRAEGEIVVDLLLKEIRKALKEEEES